MNIRDLHDAGLHHPLAGIRCHAQRIASKPRVRHLAAPFLRGWFPPPPGTLEIGVGRQPNGYTCGTETFLGICEFLRLPVDDPDDDDLASYGAKLKTTARYGTDPQDIVDTAIDFLNIEARVVNGCTIEELARITNGTQAYVDRLLGGGPITDPLEIAMVTYQAYLDPDRVRGWMYPGGFRHARRTGTARLRKIRDGRRVLWENDWSDGHWSAVLRVVQGGEELTGIQHRIGSRVRKGVVILGDPSNGEGLSFVPIPEFVRRWHDTDRRDDPRFHRTAVVLRVSRQVLRRMRVRARQVGVPMFATVRRNAVLYAP